MNNCRSLFVQGSSSRVSTSIAIQTPTKQYNKQVQVPYIKDNTIDKEIYCKFSIQFPKNEKTKFIL